MIAPHEVAEAAVEAAGGQAVAVVGVSSEADLRWANSMLTTNGERTSTTLTVVRFRDVAGGVAAGIAAGPVRDRSDIDALAERADATARSGSPAPDARPLVEGAPPAADWADDIPLTGSDAFADLAPRLGDAFARGRDEAIEHFGYAEQSVATTFLASSTGLRLRHTQRTARVEATAKSHARTRSAWSGRAADDMAGVDFGAVEADLRRGLSWQARSVVVEPGRHDTILTPSAVADMLVYQLWSSSARDAAEGRNAFGAPGGTRLGEVLSEAPLTLSSDPLDPVLACAPFATAAWSSGLTSVFDLGLGLGRTDWVRDGELAHLVSTRASADELGVAASPIIDNLRLEHGEGSGDLDDLVARTDRALLVTCLWYIREVDPRTLLLTGLTRDGVYLVEGGEVVGSVGNYRFNVSPVDLLGQVADASEAVRCLPREWGDYFTRAVTPGVLVRDFNMSTRSDAL